MEGHDVLRAYATSEVGDETSIDVEEPDFYNEAWLEKLAGSVAGTLRQQNPGLNGKTVYIDVYAMDKQGNIYGDPIFMDYLQ